jgi:hypothetical protein
VVGVSELQLQQEVLLCTHGTCRYLAERIWYATAQAGYTYRSTAGLPPPQLSEPALGFASPLDQTNLKGVLFMGGPFEGGRGASLASQQTRFTFPTNSEVNALLSP